LVQSGSARRPPPADRECTALERSRARLAAVAGFALSCLSLMLCDENCTERSWQLNAQWWCALIGLFVALGMRYCARRRWVAPAAVALIVALILYGGWAILLLAAPER
jgi:peptidoglycan/LPS O-acetylase OafA/YrhL